MGFEGSGGDCSVVGMGDEVWYGVIGMGMMGVEYVYNFGALLGVWVVVLVDLYGPSLVVGLVAVVGYGGWFVVGYLDHWVLFDVGVCDALVIVMFNYTHVIVLRDVLDIGLLVLVEKFLCTIVVDCWEVIE